MPWVILVSAACAFGNLALLVLNVVERHYQQQRLTLHPPSPTSIRHTLSMIHALSIATLVATVVFAVVGITWSVKRRSRNRVTWDGEAGVEPLLRTVQPVAFWAVWSLLGIAVLASLRAHSFVHDGMTVNDFIGYRTYLAVGHAARVIMWSCYITLVVLATQLQDRREAATPPDFARASSAAAFSESTQSATRICAITMLAAGDPANQAARQAVIRALRVRGSAAYDDQWIVHDLQTLGATRIEPYLAPLNQFMDPRGKETVMGQVAAVSLADGPLTAAESTVLETMAAALAIGPADLDRIVGTAWGRRDGLGAGGVH